jgi:hypothetical protein
MRVSHPPLAGEAFAKLPLAGCADAADAASAACAAFGWGPPTQALLYLLPGEGSARAIQRDPLAASAVLCTSAPLFASDPVAAGSWLLARVPPLPQALASTGAAGAAGSTSLTGGGGGGGSDSDGMLRAVEALSKDLQAVRLASQWLIPPETRDKAPHVVFHILRAGAPVGCGFFVTQTLALTASRSMHASGLAPGFSGRTLAGEELLFDIEEDLVGDDFMILRAPRRQTAAAFNVAGRSRCATLLGSKSVSLLGCGIAVSDVPAIKGGHSTLGASLTITETNVCHVGSSNKHFGYTAATYDGDSGACLFFSTDSCCVVGIHQEGVSRAKELVELEEGLAGGHAGATRAKGELKAVTESVKSIVRDMATGGIGLFLGADVVQDALERAKARGT